MILVGENLGHSRRGNTRTQCITPQSPLGKVDQWGVTRKGRATYNRFDHQPQLWQLHEVLVQSRVLSARKRGEHSSQFFNYIT